MNQDFLLIELKELNKQIKELSELTKSLPDNISFPKTISLTPHVELPKDVFNHAQVDKMLKETSENNKLILKFTRNIDAYEKSIKEIKTELEKDKTQKVNIENPKVEVTNLKEIETKEVAVKRIDELLTAIKNIKLKYPELIKVKNEPQSYSFIVTRDRNGRITEYIEKYKNMVIKQKISRDVNGNIISGNVEVI